MEEVIFKHMSISLVREGTKMTQNIIIYLNYQLTFSSDSSNIVARFSFSNTVISSYIKDVTLIKYQSSNSITSDTIICSDSPRIATM